MELNMSNLAIEDLEQVYDSLAIAVDSVPENKRELFLVKLALLNANAINNKDSFIKMIDQALLFED